MREARLKMKRSNRSTTYSPFGRRAKRTETDRCFWYVLHLYTPVVSLEPVTCFTPSCNLAPVSQALMVHSHTHAALGWDGIGWAALVTQLKYIELPVQPIPSHPIPAQRVCEYTIHHSSAFPAFGTLKFLCWFSTLVISNSLSWVIQVEKSVQSVCACVCVCVCVWTKTVELNILAQLIRGWHVGTALRCLG